LWGNKLNAKGRRGIRTPEAARCPRKTKVRELGGRFRIQTKICGGGMGRGKRGRRGGK